MAKSTKKMSVVKGGSGSMFGKQGANPAKPGATALSQPGKGAKFAAGGKTKMFGKQSSMPAKCG